LSRVFVIPDWLDFDIAATLPVQALTAHYLVHSTVPLSKDDIVVVHAAAGGTGRLLVAMAAARGAKVIGTVSSPEKAEIAKKCGAWEVINYKDEPEFDKKVRELTKGEGVMCVFDSVGATTWRRSLSCLKPRGHLVLFGNPSGAVPPVDPFLLMSSGSIFMTRPNLAHHLLTREEFNWRMNDVLEYVKNGTLDISISGRFKLEDAFKAHKMLEARQTTGKLLIKPN
jgi:NADPH2:quinone reductase